MYNRKTILLQPNSGITISEQITNCLSQLEAILETSNQQFYYILKQTIFIDAKDNIDFDAKKNEILLALNEFYNEEIPPSSFVGQSPDNNKKLAFEILIISQESDSLKIEYKYREDIKYTLVMGNKTKEIIAAGISNGNTFQSIDIQTEEAFEIMNRILKEEGLTFANVVRQWNFLENIFEQKTSEEVSKQNYQIFNDIRSKYYNTATFDHGYPAATGIGMNSGGIVIEFIAVEFSKEISIIPISNPLQLDAHSYSANVLIGAVNESMNEKSSPKFERAKLIETPEETVFYISGTASISGEDTRNTNDIKNQTLSTLNNIQHLISAKNLMKLSVNLKLSLNTITNLRIYVKKKEDIQTVKQICSKYFNEIPILYTIADICREELLVEIEGDIVIGNNQ